MKLTLLVAEHAAAHPDATFSALRVGIDRIQAPALPITFRAMLILRFRAEPGESGNHAWRLCAIDEDGRRVAPDLEGTFQTPSEGGAGQLLIGFAINLQNYGSYRFQVTIDSQIAEEWPFKVVEAPGKAGAK